MSYSNRGPGGPQRGGYGGRHEGGWQGSRPGGQGGGRPPGGPPQGGGSGGPAGGGRDWDRLLRPPEQPFVYFAPNSDAPRAEMLDREAEEVAKRLASLPASQLRRFYGAVMALRRRLELDKDKSVPDEEIHAQLALLKAQAAYTYRRRERDYPQELVAFFTRHAAAVRTRKDFLLGFQKHFEAVVAYHKVFEQKRGEA